MKDTQFKILKTMNEATGRMDFTMFSHNVNLTPNETIVQMQQLAQEGFLQKVGAGYAITEKGKNSLKVNMNVPEDKTFNFFVDVNKPLGFTARSIGDFYRLIKQVVSDSLDFHLNRGDFENWVRQVIKDDALADRINEIKAEDIKGEQLRKALVKALDERYGISDSP